MELKELLLQMIHADHKLRPSAKEVLNSPTIRNQVCETKWRSDIDMGNVSDMSYAITICI